MAMPLFTGGFKIYSRIPRKRKKKETSISSLACLISPNPSSQAICDYTYTRLSQENMLFMREKQEERKKKNAKNADVISYK
jgi:hypothetical protein